MLLHTLSEEEIMHRRAARIAGILLGALLGISPVAASQTPTESPKTLRDGQHDWDTMFGTWKIHLRRRLRPLTGSNEWVELESHDATRKVWQGRANLDELEADGPSGHIEGLTLRLYNPHSHQWSIYWANSRTGALEKPMIGGFQNGHGEFYDQEMLGDRSIYVRFLWTNVTENSGDFEQAFSDDGGKTWEANWVTTMEREKPGQGNIAPNPDNHDGQHDFDWEFGKWKVHAKRLAHPLSRSQEWLQYDGTLDVSKIWNGRANIVEFEAANATSHFEGLSLRLFDPKTHQWTVSWANADDGALDRTPMVGGFENGRGEFFSFQQSNDRWVMVRLILSGTETGAVHGEQAFSTDGGKTWETNFIEDFSRE
jgi:hypothetical protein